MHSQALPEYFFTVTKNAPTLGISTCNQDSGGCPAFVISLAETLDHDYVCISDGTNQSKKGIFKEDITKAYYENVYLSGCMTFDPYFFELANQKYDFSKLKNVFIIFPPWINHTPEYEEFSRSWDIIYKMHFNHSIKLLVTNIPNSHPNFLGIPRPIPAITYNPHKKVLEDEILGVIYIRHLILCKEQFKQAFLFLEQYFSKITRIATEKGISKPSILILSQDEMEKPIYEVGAEEFNVNLIFKEKLPSDQFFLALKELKEKNGILATNGVITFFQGSLSECDVLFHANKTPDVVKDLVNQMPQQYQVVAREIVGLSSEFVSAGSPEQVREVYRIIHQTLENSIQKFETLKKTSQNETLPEDKSKESQNIARELLASVTGLQWKCDNKKHLLYYVGEISTSTLDKLKPLQIKKNRIAKGAKMFAGHDIYIMTDTSENLASLKKILTQKPSDLENRCTT